MDDQVQETFEVVKERYLEAVSVAVGLQRELKDAEELVEKLRSEIVDGHRSGRWREERDGE